MTVGVAATLVAAAGVVCAQTPPPKSLSVLDLALGMHAVEMPQHEFADIACGTRGGPPSRRLDGFLDYAVCAAEADTGLHEVHFRHDDEVEFAAKARRLDFPSLRYGSTTVYGIPVIVSVLFDGNGFLVGKRIVTDPRGLDTATREISISLWNFFRGRFKGDEWQCADLEVLEGEQPYGGPIPEAPLREAGRRRLPTGRLGRPLLP